MGCSKVIGVIPPDVGQHCQNSAHFGVEQKSKKGILEQKFL